MDSRILQKELLNFSAYSSLQKLSLFFVIVCLFSWICSAWTLPFLYFLGVFLGVKISDIIVSQDNLNDILRKVVLEFDNILTHIKRILQNNNDLKVKDTRVVSLPGPPVPSPSTQITHSDIGEYRWISDNDSSGSPENIPKSIMLELNSIQLLIVRDFVHSWFTTFSTNPQFPREIKHLLHQTFVNIAAQCYQQHSDILLIKFLRLYQYHFATFRKAKLTYESHRVAPGTKVLQDHKIKRHLSVDDAFSSLVSFHYAVQSESNEFIYMRSIVNLLLISLAEPPLLRGPGVKTLLIEILTSRVFLPVIHLISDPYFLMQVIIHVTSDEEIASAEPSNDSEGPQVESIAAETDSASSHQIFETNGINMNEEFSPLGNICQSPGPRENSKEQEILYSPDYLNDTFLDCEHSSHELDTNELQSFHHIEMTSYTVNTITSYQSAVVTPSESIDTSSSLSTPSLVSTLQMLKEHDDISKQQNIIPKYSDPQSLPSTTQNTVSHYLSPSIPESSEENGDANARNVDCQADEMSSSLSKLTSLKNFFVDSLKSGGRQQTIKKPKTLQLFYENSSTIRKDFDCGLNPPQVFVDGVPEESETQSSPMLSEPDLTPSSGFLSSMHAWFGLSMSASQEFTSPAETPDLTPSPLPGTPFNINDVAVVKESELDSTKPFLSDDMRIFQDIAIPEAFPFRDEKSSSTYSLYIIEYEALYFTEEGKSVIRSGVVKRRYREFTNLQSRLETQQAYKKYLKNIRVPKRWPTLPFKTLDKETVETRRVFLEKYLKDLITNEAICNGPDLREFLAYEGNSHIAFVKKSPDSMVPRIDKIFMRSVSGVMDRIKQLPSLPQEVISGLRGRDMSDEKLALNKNQSDPDSIECWSDFADESAQVTDQVNVLVASCTQLLADHKLDEHFSDLNLTSDQKSEHKAESYKQEVEKVLSELQNFDLTHQNGSEDLDCGVLLELLVQGLQDHWLCRDRVLRSAQSLLSKTLAGTLQSALSKLTTEEQVVSYLTQLRKTVWPQGQFRSGSHLHMSDIVKATTRSKAKQSLIDMFPKLFQSAIGVKQLEDLIDVFLCSLESQRLNKQLIYTCLDVLIEQLFPEVTGSDFLQKLFLQSRC